MSTVTYTTRDGDTVDSIAYGYYGTLDGRQYEQIYAANPGLADGDPVLSMGTVIILPDLTTAQTAQGVRLWD